MTGKSSSGLVKLSFFLISSLTLAGCASEQNTIIVNNPVNVGTDHANALPRVFNRGSESGKKKEFAHFMSVNPDCTSIGYAIVKVTKEPAHGKVSAEQGESFPDFLKENSRAVCNSKKIPSMVVSYQSEDGYLGMDSFSLEVVSASGQYSTYSYTMTVVKP